MMLPPLFYLFLCCWMTLQVVWKEQWFGNLDAWVLNFVRVFVKCNVSNEERFSLSWWQPSVNPSHQGVWGQRVRRSTELQTSESTCFISVTNLIGKSAQSETCFDHALSHGSLSVFYQFIATVWMEVFSLTCPCIQNSSWDGHCMSSTSS